MKKKRKKTRYPLDVHGLFVVLGPKEFINHPEINVDTSLVKVIHRGSLFDNLYSTFTRNSKATVVL